MNEQLDELLKWIDENKVNRFPYEDAITVRSLTMKIKSMKQSNITLPTTTNLQFTRNANTSSYHRTCKCGRCNHGV